MIWMLDTNICRFVIRQRPLAVKEHFDQVGHDNLAVSTIVLAELQFGAALHPARGTAILNDIEDFCPRLRVLTWTEAAARCYGQLRAQLQRAGTPISNMDRLIAAHAVAKNAVLVTNNGREFERIPGLRRENWL